MYHYSKILEEDSVKEIKRSGYLFQMTFGRKLLKDIHAHNFYEIIIVLKGGCKHTVNGRICNCKAGDITILRPYDEHCFDEQEEGTSVAALSASCREVNKFKNAFGLEVTDNTEAFGAYSKSADIPDMIKLSGMETMRIQNLCNEIFALSDSKRTDMCRVLLSEVLGFTVKNKCCDTKEIPRRFSEILSEVNKLENAAGGVEKFLKISNFSHAQLCRLTKKYLDMTPSEYITGIRMKYAEEMVLSGELDYETICEKVGFNSLSHFYDLFKKNFGMTPASMRKSRYKKGRTV